METKSKILIVDDNIDTLELLVKRFRAEGYETDVARDGEEALAKVTQFWPDLVILDVMMPKIDGLEVCRRLKTDDTTRIIPILMLTAKSSLPEKVRGFENGADDYLTKPFDFKELAVRARSLLVKKAANLKLVEDEKHEALDRMVDEMAHEVRNPLVVIGGFARRIYKSLPERDQNRAYLEIILKNVDVLEKMVRQLFELKTASLTYFEESDVHEIIRQVLWEDASRIQENGIEVRIELLVQAPPIPVDRQNLKRAFHCLIENAIEAMVHPPKVLEIRTKVDNGSFIVTIGDTGKGISREKLKNIFLPFFSSKLYGPGLGLSFVQKTIHNHRGAITVASQEGMGTVFTIELPRKTYLTSSGGSQQMSTDVQ